MLFISHFGDISYSSSGKDASPEPIRMPRNAYNFPPEKSPMRSSR